MHSVVTATPTKVATKVPAKAPTLYTTSRPCDGSSHGSHAAANSSPEVEHGPDVPSRLAPFTATLCDATSLSANRSAGSATADTTCACKTDYHSIIPSDPRLASRLAPTTPSAMLHQPTNLPALPPPTPPALAKLATTPSPQCLWRVKTCAPPTRPATLLLQDEDMDGESPRS
jgi:hypothetical protein